MQIILRPDQQKLKSEIYGGWSSGVRHMLAVLPTGGGKSVIVSDIALDGHSQGMKQCVIAHRKELVGQMSLHIARRGIYHRIIGPKETISDITSEHRREFGRSFLNPSADCSVAGVDTLISRSDTLKQWAEQQQRVTIDEAHHVLLNNKWGKGITMFPNAHSLGVTASPSRADGQGLGLHCDGIYGAMVIGPTMRELISIGALCDYEIVVPESDFNISEDHLGKDGDFTRPKMREASQKSHIVGDVVKEYCKYAYGKRGVTFATDVETAKEIAEQFNVAGIPAAAVSALTPAATRSEYIRRFRAGQLWQLVNVDLFGEGFDLPAIEVVSMARPTASLAVYLQQFGRALRILAGKPFGLVIDHVSNYKRHGFPDKAHCWTLDRREKRARTKLDPESIELTRCTNCARAYERVKLFCPHCGYVPILPEPGGGGRSIEQVDGDLLLLDRETLAAMRASIELASPASVAGRAGHVAGGLAAAGSANRQIEKIQAQQRLKDALAHWAGYQRSLHRSDSETHRRFYLTVGASILDVLSAERTRQEYEKMAETIEGWLPS
jgi:DNA repair protein RadD